MRYLILILLSFPIHTSCSRTTNIPDGVHWEITKEEPNPAIRKNNIEVMLNKKIDREALRQIALEIRKDRTSYEKLWISYRIPNMTEGMAWATTHFIPDLEIEIIGSTESEDQLTSDTSKIPGKVIGKWRCEKSLMGATLIMFNDSLGKTYIRITFKDGSSSDSEVVETEKKWHTITK